MARPLIAVTGMVAAKVTGLRLRGVAASEKVLECVFRAGAEPVVLPPGPPEHAAERLARFDGLLVPGGDDLSPELYGGTADPAFRRAQPVQDLFELAALRHAVAAGLPTLAICRGLQALNVALGGSLVGDLGERGDLHRNGYHEVALTPGCRVARAMNARTVSVSSYHHQAVDRLGTGLTATGLAPDGVVEAVEHETAPVLAVQWHPEDDAVSNPREQALFDALAAAAARVATQAVPA
jgi:putative glutamine amidotransferase